MPKEPYLIVRHSPIHGYGAFAARRIRKGTRIIEYQGERIAPAEGDRRYADAPDDSIILLFTVNKRVTIDAGVGGNDARFINHSCDPNCETVDEDAHIYIEAIRTIQPGEELSYDYHLTRDEGDGPKAEAKYACKCGSPNCRGTMLEPAKKKRKKKAKKKQ